MNAGPLAGLKVLEIAGIGPAPCCGMMLADMGASVTLVDRKLPNANAAAAITENSSGSSAIFNRGKRSIAIDLKSAEGIELVLKLVEDCDILIEGFRPGVMERLGLGPDVCLQRNSKLIYGRMTGWGQTGPLAQSAGHDPNYIGISGAMWAAARQDSPPVSPLTVIGDMGGGAMMLAWGIVCAVIESQRSGQGQVIDAAICDGTAYLSTLLWYLRSAGQLPDELDSSWVTGAAPWNNTYLCADEKFITVCALEPQFYQELVQQLELTDNPVFAEQWDVARWPQGKEELNALFLTKSREQWCDLLEGSDVCFGPVLDFSEALQHPHNKARNSFLEVNGVNQPAPAPKFSRSQPTVGVLPASGEHTDAILRAAHLDDETIASLKGKGVV